jgi:hypothetical protein
VWFNRGQVEGSNYRSLLQPDGSWKDNFANVLTVNGNEVRGTVRQQPVRLTLKAGGPSTILEGQVGAESVFIELGAEKLVMRSGLHKRELVREDERPREDRTCIRYRTGEGLAYSDFLDVCGEALSKKPPLVPLALAFLQNGFRPLAAVMPQPTPPVAPKDPLSTQRPR